VSLLILSILLGAALGVGATVVGRDYLSEVRYKLGTMLIDASGAGPDSGTVEPTPTATPSR